MIFNSATRQAAHDREAAAITAHAAAQLPAGHPDRCPNCGVRAGDNHADCEECYSFDWSNE